MQATHRIALPGPNPRCVCVEGGGCPSEPFSLNKANVSLTSQTKLLSSVDLGLVRSVWPRLNTLTGHSSKHYVHTHRQGARITPDTPV